MPENEDEIEEKRVKLVSLHALEKLLKKHKLSADERDDEPIYISFDDLKELYEKYAELEDRFNSDDEAQAVTPEFLRIFEEKTEAVLKQEIRDLSEERRLEHDIRFAKIRAQREALVPERARLHWWSLFKRPNRALRVIEDAFDITADELHSTAEHDNDLEYLRVEELKKELDKDFIQPEKQLSERKLKRLKKKAKKLNRTIACAELCAVVPTTPPPPPKPRRRKPEAQPAVVVAQTPGQLPGQVSIEEIRSEA